MMWGCRQVVAGTSGLVRVFAALAAVLAAGCEAVQPTTELDAPGRHVGEVALLRVADTDPYVVGSESGSNPAARFVGLRHRLDVAGLDHPQAIVHKNDYITVSLNSGFIRYFKEVGGTARKGEIALVISFDSGDTEEPVPTGGTTWNSVLVFSSTGQTLASSLDAMDWVMFGPVRVPHGDLFMRVVMIEIDRVENKRATDSIKGLASLATAVRPEAGFAIQIAQDLANFLISSNVDDVIIDQRFSLHRVAKGDTFQRGPLLYGTYVLILQEDRLAGEEVTSLARRATFVPEYHKLRYSRDSGRLYSTYNYYPVIRAVIAAYPDPNAAGLPEDGATASSPALECPFELGDYPQTFRGRRFEGRGPRDFRGPPTDPTPDEKAALAKHLQLLAQGSYRKCLLRFVNEEAVLTVRRDTLGYGDGGAISDHDIFLDKDTVFAKAYYDTARSSVGFKGTSIELVKRDREKTGYHPHYDFSVVSYPDAYTVLAQYAQHTHLIFSVELAGDKDAPRVHQRLPNYERFLKEQIEQVETANAASQLTAHIQKAVEQKNAVKAAIAKANEAKADGRTEEQQICLLYKSLVPEAADSSQPLSVAEFFANDSLFTDMRRRAGKTFSSRQDVERYLNAKECKNPGAQDCECPTETQP